MSRCDYEGVFYRVFCIGLLVIAFTFTVILTNVFIDIDGLLSRKEQESAKQDNTEHTTQAKYDQKADIPDYYNGGEKNYDEGDGAYRTKRSLGAPNFLLHVKAPRGHHLLRKQLATLLSQLEDDKPDRTVTDNNEFKDLDDIFVAQTAKKADEVKINEEGEIEPMNRKHELSGDFLHMAIHNVLLQGIAKHMDLNDVVTKVNSIVKRFKSEENNIKDNIREDQATETFSKPSEAVVKILNELSHCKTLENEIAGQTKALKKQEIKKAVAQHPKLFIKTFIDLGNTGKILNKTASLKKQVNPNENITGVIKLIYNGQAIKLKNFEEIETTTKATFKETPTNDVITNVEQIAEIIQEDYKSKQIPKHYVTTMLQDVLKKLTSTDNTNETEVINKETRSKRQVKVHKKSKKNDDDDEVFVEIETHFDAKEKKGKKKKALIKRLIEKIRNALRSNGKDKKHKHGHVKKRVQLNLSNHMFDDKYLLPYDISLYTRRELHPISKVGLKEDPLPSFSDQNGNEWKKKDFGPKFFSSSKSINSAEIRQLEVDYSKVMQVNDVPQRLQIPLNSDLSEENFNTYLDLGSLQYLIKDLEGTGFSVGLNQYVDQEPDAESIKLFTGLEKLIKTYHQYYDQGNDQNYEQNNDPNYDPNYDQNYNAPDDKASGILYHHEMKKRDIEINRYGERFIKKRSVRDNRSVHTESTGNVKDYHTNEYQIIFHNKFEPYDNYQEIFEDKHKRTLLSLNNDSHEDRDEKGSEAKGLPKDFKKLLEKKLKPSEILSLANLLDRKRRSYNVQKITNLKTNIHLNRYINTNALPKPEVMLNNNRNKRQVEKVRIYAKDQDSHSESDENVYIFSNENLFADRALRSSLPNYITNENKAEERVDDLFADTKSGVYSVYEEINPLMSKYPHIFVDDFTISKFTDDTPTVFGRVVSRPANIKSKDTRSKAAFENNGRRKSVEEQMPKVHDLVRALEPRAKTNYKVTIKLVPQEKMGNRTKEGFKEVHTSINKTFDKNGIHYSSLVNVSEISKIERKNPAMYEDYEPDKAETQTQSTAEKRLKKQTEPVTMASKEYKVKSGNWDKEKKNIKEDSPTVFKDGRRANSDMIDIVLPFNPPRTVRFSKDILGQILVSTLREDTPTTTTRVTTKKPEVFSHEIKAAELEPIKSKLLKSISQNERLTSMVLSKLDRNTGLLETFLNKITEKMQSLPDISQRVVSKIETKMPDPVVPPQVYIHPSNINVGSRLPFVYSHSNHQNKTENPGIAYHKYIYPGSNKKTLERNPLNEHSKYFVDDDDYTKRFLTVPEFKPTVKHDEAPVKDTLRPQVESFVIVEPNKNQKAQELKVNSNTVTFTSNPTNRNVSAVQFLNYGHTLANSPTAVP